MFKDMIAGLLDEERAPENEDSGAPGGEGGPAIRTDGSRVDAAATTDAVSGGTDRPERTMDLDEVFGLLQNRRRRHVLRYLHTVADHVEVGPLAVHIAACECDKPPEEITTQERKRVYVALYQSHLSKMDDAGVIDYDSRAGRIEPGPNFDDILSHLPPNE